jgi:small subunit ribosomal protein S18
MKSNTASNGKSSKKYYFTKKKFCLFCKEKIKLIDYKDSKILQNYILETGKILPARVSGTCGYHQKQLTKAIKRARHMGLIKFVEPRRG